MGSKITLYGQLQYGAPCKISTKMRCRKVPRGKGLVFDFLLAVVFASGGVFKFLHALAEAFHEFRNFFTAKEQNYNQYNQDDSWYTHISDKQ